MTRTVFGILVTLVLAAGCGQEAAKPAPKPTSTPTATPARTPTPTPTPVPNIPGLTASAVIAPMAATDAWTCTSGPPQWQCSFKSEPAAYWLRLEGPDDTHVTRVLGYVDESRAVERFRRDAAVSRLGALAQRLTYHSYDKAQGQAWIFGHGDGGSTVIAGAKWTITAAPPVWRLEVAP